MTGTFPLFWIFLLPLLGAATNLTVGQKFPRWLVQAIACASVLASLGLTLFAVFGRLYPLWAASSETATPQLTNLVFTWISAGAVDIKLGLLLDPLSAVMILIITFVGSLIHIYSTGYMKHDGDYARFFGYLNLFMSAMLLLVLGDNLAVLFVGWEGVGVCSYLLIGFWYDKDGTSTPGDANASAGRKAFITNRVGDFAFLLGMMLLFLTVGTLNINDLAAHSASLRQHLLSVEFLPISVAGAAALLLFIGATGKSAQIPLYVWLPDAMAGPTPVSALIHAATMVTAGVYMVGRLNFLYLMSPAVMGLVALVGAGTAFFAATIGIAQTDIKKVLAYSTISQLGYMFIGVGVGAFSAGIFHLFTHAFFKACLFLGAGSVIHALSGQQDLRTMGGLRRYLPLTHLTFLISTMAIAGLPLLSGFFSKDEILWQALVHRNPAWPPWLPLLLILLGGAAALCTAFYMFRLYYLTFAGRCRAEAQLLAHVHESPASMTMPLLVLAGGAAVLGFLGLPALSGLPNLFEHWLAPVFRAPLPSDSLTPVTTSELLHSHSLEAMLLGGSTVIALAGWLMARAFYRDGFSPSVMTLTQRLPLLHRFLQNKYFIDELYSWLIIRPVGWLAAFLWRVIDIFFIDIIGVSGTAWIIDITGRFSRRLHNGNLQRYVVAFVVGLGALIFFTTIPTADPFLVAPAKNITVGETVTFSAHQAKIHDHDQLQFAWDFDGDGRLDTSFSSTPMATHAYAEARTYQVKMCIRDARFGTQSTLTRQVEVQ